MEWDYYNSDTWCCSKLYWSCQDNGTGLWPSVDWSPGLKNRPIIKFMMMLASVDENYGDSIDWHDPEPVFFCPYCGTKLPNPEGDKHQFNTSLENQVLDVIREQLKQKPQMALLAHPNATVVK